MIARRMRQCLPIFTCEKMMHDSTSAYEFTRTSGDRTLVLTWLPEMMHPDDTTESTAMPVRPGSLKTNFAGGYCLWGVRIRQALSHRLNTGEIKTTSIFASRE